ncbi:MAG: hypothetical protein DSY90_09250 [Deltaproteobacteria bacterium]|nr:MAG: hypothetical protein DSY90_09250 [Deltaproteobacteria bacterium]
MCWQAREVAREALTWETAAIAGYPTGQSLNFEITGLGSRPYTTRGAAIKNKRKEYFRRISGETAKAAGSQNKINVVFPGSGGVSSSSTQRVAQMIRFQRFDRSAVADCLCKHQRTGI